MMTILLPPTNFDLAGHVFMRKIIEGEDVCEAEKIAWLTVRANQAINEANRNA
jgi:hypothetical protein